MKNHCWKSHLCRSNVPVPVRCGNIRLRVVVWTKFKFQHLSFSQLHSDVLPTESTPRSYCVETFTYIHTLMEQPLGSTWRFSILSMDISCTCSQEIWGLNNPPISLWLIATGISKLHSIPVLTRPDPAELTRLGMFRVVWPIS